MISNEDSVDTTVKPESASSDDASNNDASNNDASNNEASDSDSSSDDSASEAETEEYSDENDQDANGDEEQPAEKKEDAPAAAAQAPSVDPSISSSTTSSSSCSTSLFESDGSDDDSDEEQPAEKKEDAPAAAAQAPSVDPSISSSTTSSYSRPVDLSARLISDVPLGADVLKVRVLPYSSPGEGIHIILSSSPSAWVKLDAAGTEAKLHESLETLGNIKAQIGIARKAPGKAIGGLAGKRTSRTAAFAAGYHDRTTKATATFPESTFCVVGALANTFGWSADSAVAVRLKAVLGPLVSDWASAVPRAINNDVNIPLKLQKISGIPRAASSTPALSLEWVVREISQAAADGLDLHYIVETVDTETGKRDHVIAVTTNVGSHGAAICSDPDFTFPLLFAGPDAVAETVDRLKWWGVCGFVVGRRVVATTGKGSRKRKRD